MNHAFGSAGTTAAGLWEFLRTAADSSAALDAIEENWMDVRLIPGFVYAGIRYANTPMACPPVAAT